MGTVSNNHKSRKVLIVEDQRNWQRALGHILKSLGFEPIIATKISEAVQYLEDQQFLLIILDVRLQDEEHNNMDGINLLEQIREMGLSAKVILITGFPDSVESELVEDLNPDGQFFKGAQWKTQDFKDTIIKLVPA